MNKKLILIFTILLLIVAGAYLYLRYGYLQAKDFKPDLSKAKNALDLQPEIIAKLQQLVKDGSGGLYKLSIGSLHADVLTSKVDITNGALAIDSAVMIQLQRSARLPDDLFKIKFTNLHIDGIGIEDLLSKKHIDITGIFLNDPVIEVFHSKRPYNEAKREAKDSLSLYKRLLGNTDYIKIGQVTIGHGTYTNYNLTRQSSITKFNDVSIDLKDILIDSTTQNDPSRFLFTKHAAIACKNYIYHTADSQYLFKAGTLKVLAEQHKLIAGDVEFKPRGTKEQFERRLKHRKEMIHLTLPQIVLGNVDWLSMINQEKLIVGNAELNNAAAYIYFDKRIPPAGFIKIDNFPQQALMKMPLPIDIEKLVLHNAKVTYEEFNDEVKRSGTINFDALNGTVTNISNIPAKIKRTHFADIAATSLFMNKVPIKVKLKFDLLKYHTGEFSADIHVDTVNKEIINPVAEPLSLFSVKSGQVQKAMGHIEGNNLQTHGTISFAYTDLHITPLKSDSAGNGKLKKKTFSSFFANALLIKNANPSKGKPLRQEEFSVNRSHYPNFFNFVWVSIATGVLKTIGIPVKLVLK